MSKTGFTTVLATLAVVVAGLVLLVSAQDEGSDPSPKGEKRAATKPAKKPFRRTTRASRPSWHRSRSDVTRRAAPDLKRTTTHGEDDGSNYDPCDWSCEEDDYKGKYYDHENQQSPISNPSSSRELGPAPPNTPEPPAEVRPAPPNNAATPAEVDPTG